MPTSWVDQVLAKFAKLKASVSMLHNELSELIGSQVKMDQLRRQDAETYVRSKANTRRGLEDSAPQCSCRDRHGIIGSLGNSRARHAQDSAVVTTEDEAAAVVDDRMCKKNELSEPRRRKMRHIW